MSSCASSCAPCRSATAKRGRELHARRRAPSLPGLRVLKNHLVHWLRRRTLWPRSAELRRRPPRPERAPKVSASGAALLLMSAAKGGRGAVAQAALLRQLANLAKALYDMHRADQDARRAAEIERAIRRELAAVSARLPDPGPVGHPDAGAAAVVRTARQAQTSSRPPGSPVPNPIEMQQRRTPAGRPSTDHGIER